MLTWCNDPESYAGGSVATVRATHARQVKGEQPDKERYPGPPGLRLGVLLATAPRKKSIAAKVQRGNFGQMQGRRNRLFEMDNEKKIKLATWNIRTMLQVGKMMEIAEVLQKWEIRGLLEKYPTFGREKETGLLGALDT